MVVFMVVVAVGGGGSIPSTKQVFDFLALGWGNGISELRVCDNFLRLALKRTFQFNLSWRLNH